MIESSTRDFVDRIAADTGTSRFEAARFIAECIQDIMAEYRDEHIEALRKEYAEAEAAAERSKSILKKLDELGAPLKPRAPRADKGKPRKSKELGVDGDGSGSAVA